MSYRQPSEDLNTIVACNGYALEHKWFVCLFVKPTPQEHLKSFLLPSKSDRWMVLGQKYRIFVIRGSTSGC